MSTLHSQVFESLIASGHFSDPLLAQIKAQFLPAIITNAANKVQDVQVARKLVDALLADALARYRNDAIGIQKSSICDVRKTA